MPCRSFPKIHQLLGERYRYASNFIYKSLTASSSLNSVNYLNICNVHHNLGAYEYTETIKRIVLPETMICRRSKIQSLNYLSGFASFERVCCRNHKTALTDSLNSNVSTLGNLVCFGGKLTKTLLNVLRWLQFCIRVSEIKNLYMILL